MLLATLLGLLLAVWTPLPQDTAKAPMNADGPRLVIESFAPASAYAVGSEPVALVGTIRNVGRSGSPADVFIARVSALAGLDYTEGDTRPKVPALEPNATATFRWKLAPSAYDSPLVASLTLEGGGGIPDSKVLSIQHFAEPPPADSAFVAKEATARGGQNPTLENATMRVRVVQSEASVPSLILSTHTPTGWRRIGTTVPIASVLSAEGGQRPWWEVFRTESVRASVTKGMASLTLTGGFGLRWRGTVVLTLRTGSSVLDTRLLLAPLKSLKLAGARLMPLYAGDGSFGSAAAETLDREPGTESESALRWGSITIGANWLEQPTLGAWTTSPLQSPAGADYSLIGTEWMTDGPPLAVSTASLVEWRARVFALSPSASVSDARKIPLPAKPFANTASSR
jgi:hypothetical protein